MFTRIITGVTLLFFFSLTFLLDDEIWLIVISLIAIPAAVEWRTISGTSAQYWLVTIVIWGMILAAVSVLPLYWLLLMVHSGFVLFVIVSIRQKRMIERVREGIHAVSDAGFVVCVSATITSLYLLPLLLDHSRWFIVVLLLGVVAMADIGGYFVGRAIGKTRLAPTISPGKTVQGAIGGMVFAVIWSLAFAPYSGHSLVMMVLLGALGAASSVFGDLSESVFKRISGQKDSGHLLPGHGGVLDRVDGMVFAVPVMAIVLLLFGQ